MKAKAFRVELYDRFGRLGGNRKNRIMNKTDLIKEGQRLGVYNPENKLALLVGSSNSWRKDIESFKRHFPGVTFDIIAINQTMERIENVTHWVTKHPGSSVNGGWDKTRLAKGWKNDFKKHSCQIPLKYKTKGYDYWRENFDCFWEIYSYNQAGSSGVFGLYVAMGLGYKGVVTCGIELYGEYRNYFSAFRMFNQNHRGYFKSMSGILCVPRNVGKPDVSWVKGVMK